MQDETLAGSFFGVFFGMLGSNEAFFRSGVTIAPSKEVGKEPLSSDLFMIEVMTRARAVTCCITRDVGKLLIQLYEKSLLL
jgi:hypothetical protein